MPFFNVPYYQVFLIQTRDFFLKSSSYEIQSGPALNKPQQTDRGAALKQAFSNQFKSNFVFAYSLFEFII